MKVWTKDIMYWFIKVKLFLTCREVLELVFSLNELEEVALRSNSNTNSKHAPQVVTNYT